MIIRWAASGLALLLFGACGPCGGSTSVSSTGNGCAHPGLCLTLTGSLAGATSGLVQSPDCIADGGLDVVFTTHVGSHETSIEILVTDVSAKSTPGFHPGLFAIRSSHGASAVTPFASVYIKPDTDVPGFPGGWSTDAVGSSGSVVINADQSGRVQDAVVPPARGTGASLHLSGAFDCH